MTDPLDSLALDGSPAQAFATHKARGNGIARFFAETRLLKDIKSEQAGEDNVHTLIAHFHMLGLEPGFTPPGQEPSATAAPAALRRLNRGNGLVGTEGVSTKRDYDMALKGLMILLYRYRVQLGSELIDFIMSELVPDHMVGGHSPSIEIVEQSFLNIDTPETENHLLMIESSRYLINQLKHDQTPDPKFDNKANGLEGWLLGCMQTFLRHDFLEFNSRPYQRLALHPILNLHEFARDPVVRRAAQMVLDYTMMKFALSSSRGRRVAPYRRVQPRINHRANVGNYLYADKGDQVAGFFLACTGQIGSDGNPTRFPASLAFTGLLAGLAPYRPPSAAYILAMRQDNPSSLHRFYHGKRPVLRAGEQAEGGLEIYNHSPSFLISAGGSFLNSGYGKDEVDIFGKHAWNETSRAQATSIIPTRADALFCDLIRFEPYPDPRIDPYHDDPEDPDRHYTRGVNYGVVRNLAAGANMRPAERTTVLEESTAAALALAQHNGTMFAAWKGSGNDNISVARVQGTTLMGIDGVEGIEQKVSLAETSDTSPAIASHGGRLFLAWKGSGNDQLNIAVSTDDGRSFTGKKVLAEESEFAPALASHNGRLYLAWTGLDENLNVAKVIVFANTAGGAGVEGIEGKVSLGDTSEAAPALCSHNGRLFLGWKGSGNDELNLAFSSDGVGFGGKRILSETSSHGPSLASHGGRLFLSWKGSGNENLNVARLTLIGNTAGGFAIEGIDNKVTLPDFSEEPPAIASWNDLLFIGWKGEDDDNLDFRISRDGSFAPVGPWIFADRSNLGYYLAAFRAPPTHPDQLVEPLDSLGLAYIVEKQDMDARGISFETFKQTVFNANSHLTPTLNYGGRYQFNTIDGRKIGIWFEFVEQKFTPRVVDMSEPVEDFGTLPLVSGEFMRAPSGHDGLIEIRSPGCETPLVLDFRAPGNPVRLDNIGACPEPWLDRAQALLSFAQKLSEAGRYKEEIASLTDRVEIYQQLTEIDPTKYRPDLASALNLLAGNLWALVVRLLEAQRIDEVSAPALEAIQVYRQAAAAGSEVTGIATSLIRLSSWLAHAGLAADSLSAAQTAVDVLRGVQPPASEQVSYLALLAQSLRTLVLQLLQTQQINEVSAPALEAIQVYQQAAAAGAEVTGIAHDLQTLSSWLANARLTAEAVSAAQAAVDLLRGVQPPATEQVAYLTLLAGNLSTLVLWLIDAQRVNEVSAPALEAIQVYQQAAAAGAEVTEIVTSLRTLSSWLANAGLTAEASAAADVAASILP